jgi:hypothetical protein
LDRSETAVLDFELKTAGYLEPEGTAVGGRYICSLAVWSNYPNVGVSERFVRLIQNPACKHGIARE